VNTVDEALIGGALLLLGLALRRRTAAKR